MEEIKNKPKTKAQKEREKSDATFKKLEEQASKLKEKAKKGKKKIQTLVKILKKFNMMENTSVQNVQQKMVIPLNPI